MKGILISYESEMKDGKAVVKLYGRSQTGKSFLSTHEYQPYFYIKAEDEERAKELLAATFHLTDKKTMQEEPLVQVKYEDFSESNAIQRVLEEQNIPTYEADLALHTKFILDHELLTLIEIEGTEQEGEKTDVQFFNAKVSPSTTRVEPTILSFDIETDKTAKEIYSISIIYQDKEEVLVAKNKAFEEEKELENYITLVETEKELLETFLQRIEDFDPDILTGWHVIDFDCDLIAKRCKEHNITFQIGRGDKPTALRIEQSFFRDSKVYCQGRVVLDGIQLLKSSFVKLEDYKLNTAAKEFLDDTKLIEEKERFAIIDNYYHTNPNFFAAYNLKDSRLVLDILEASKVLELTLQRSILTGLPLDKVKASIASFDSVYIPRLHKAGYVAPTMRPVQRDEGMGGFVMTSKPGLYDNVIVLDFKSLYPSIMRTFQIDPVTYVGRKEEIEQTLEKEKYIVAPNGAVFNNQEAILASLLKNLWEERDLARKEGNELARYAIKIMMNSMYGVLASPNSRFHNRQISNAITSFGQHFIKHTAKLLNEKGYEVIYGDTDSVFVDIKTTDSKQAKKIGKNIERTLNTYLMNHIKEEYACSSIMELEFEKLFVKFFMPTVRKGPGGAKKRYAGMQDGKDTLDVTGLEIVRSDWTAVAKIFQEQLLFKLFRDEPVEGYIKTFVQEVKEGKMDNQLVYRKSLRKPLSEYTKTTPPHVKAARLLKKVEDKVISYVITKEGPQPIQNITAPLDYDHYIEKQIQPIADTILEALGKTFESINSSQTGLGSFF